MLALNFFLLTLLIIFPFIFQDTDTGSEEEATDPGEHQSFNSVISNLQQMYSKDKMQDINTGFYFIHFLHLANERELKIKAGERPGVEGEGKPEEGDNRMRSLES